MISEEGSPLRFCRWRVRFRFVFPSQRNLAMKALQNGMNMTGLDFLSVIGSGAIGSIGIPKGWNADEFFLKIKFQPRVTVRGHVLWALGESFTTCYKFLICDVCFLYIHSFESWGWFFFCPPLNQVTPIERIKVWWSLGKILGWDASKEQRRLYSRDMQIAEKLVHSLWSIVLNVWWVRARIMTGMGCPATPFLV